MSRIRGKDTSIELKVRHWLYHQGYRYRKNVKELPGKPDIVLRPYNTVILIHGCFWHRHEGCKIANTPKSRIEFWKNKFNRNIENDRKHIRMLEDMGYQVVIIWECEIEKRFDETMEKLVGLLGLPHRK